MYLPKKRYVLSMLRGDKTILWGDMMIYMSVKSRMTPATLSILPPASVDDLWRKDYENMQKTMIYGNSPSYEQLLKRLAELQKEFKMLPYQP